MTILYFAHARRATGLDMETLTVSAPMRAAALWERLIALHPELAPLLAASRLARANEFISSDAIIDPDDEIAVIPPVSGG